MNPVPAFVKATRLPQVNLVPPEVGLRRALAKQRVLILMALGAFLVLIAGGYALLVLASESVQDQAEEERNLTDQLNMQIAALEEVEVVEVKLANGDSVRKYVGSTEIIYAEFWPIMVEAFPPGTKIEQLLLDTSTLGVDAVPDPNPFAPVDVGSLTFKIVLPTYVSVPEVEAALNDVDVFQNARVTSVEQTDTAAPEGGTPTNPTGGYRLTGVVRINYEAFSQRFSPEWYGVDDKQGTADDYAELLEDARDAVVPVPSPSPSPSEDDEDEDSGDQS